MPFKDRTKRVYERADIEEVSLEKIRDVVAALAKHLNVTLYEYEWNDGGHDFEFRLEKSGNES